MANNAQSLNGDRMRRAVMRSSQMTWQPSPSGTVWRKRLHRVGPAESGQVTAIVRYEPGASFPGHDHPEGEEILVLEGIFSDEHGDWPAGTYLLNPEGFRHAPFSRPGCLLFVKLRQYAGEARHHVAIDTTSGDWQPGEQLGVEVQTLYANPAFPDATRLERWAAGTVLQTLQRPGGIEVLVLDGSFEDDSGCYEKGDWLRLPDGAEHQPRSANGCLLYIKSGAVSSLRTV